jgi:hypothetical protein
MYTNTNVRSKQKQNNHTTVKLQVQAFTSTEK